MVPESEQFVVQLAVETDSVNVCVASVPTPLCAVNVIGNTPVTVGVPLRTSVVALKVTPFGSGPVSAMVGAGNPVAVTVNDPGAFRVNVALVALVIAGAWSTVIVKFCVALVPTPFNAVKVIGYVPP